MDGLALPATAATANRRAQQKPRASQRPPDLFKRSPPTAALPRKARQGAGAASPALNRSDPCGWLTATSKLRFGLSRPSWGGSWRVGAVKAQARTQTIAHHRFLVSTSPRAAPRKRGCGFADVTCVARKAQGKTLILSCPRCPARTHAHLSYAMLVATKA